MAEANVARLHGAGVALLKALGVKDLDGVRGFTLTFHCDDLPVLVVERYVGAEMGDKTALAAAAQLNPQVEERAVWG